MNYEFAIKDGKVVHHGILCAPTEVVYQAGDYYLWYEKSSHYFGGTGRPWLYSPIRLQIIHVIKEAQTPGRMIGKVVHEEKPGAKWRSARQRLIARVDELALGVEVLMRAPHLPPMWEDAPAVAS